MAALDGKNVLLFHGLLFFKWVFRYFQFFRYFFPTKTHTQYLLPFSKMDKTMIVLKNIFLNIFTIFFLSYRIQFYNFFVSNFLRQPQLFCCPSTYLFLEIRFCLILYSSKFVFSLLFGSFCINGDFFHNAASPGNFRFSLEKVI